MGSFTDEKRRKNKKVDRRCSYNFMFLGLNILLLFTSVWVHYLKLTTSNIIVKLLLSKPTRKNSHSVMGQRKRIKIAKE